MSTPLATRPRGTAGPRAAGAGTTLPAAVAATLIAWLVSIPVALPAAALPPENLPDELTDHVQLLSPDQAAAIGQVQDRLVQEKGLQLFVVVVDDFDGMPPRTWLEETATKSGLGEQDMALALAPDAGVLELRVPEATGLDRRAVTRVEDEARELLAAGDASGAVLAVATGLDETTQLDPAARTARLVSWVVGLLLVLSVLGGLYWRVTSAARRRRRDAEDLESARDLARRTGARTLALDDAIEAARLEIEFAAAEFDPPLVASLRETVESAGHQALEAHRRRAEVATGPVDDVRWQRPPAEALAQLRQIDEVTSTALERLTTVTAQLSELRRQSDLVPTRIAGLREVATRSGHEETSTQVNQLLDRATADVAAGRPEAALLPLQTVVALLAPQVSGSPQVNASGNAAVPSPDRGAPGR